MVMTKEQILNPESLYYKACDIIKDLKFNTTFEEVCTKLSELNLDITDTSQIYLALDWAHQWSGKELY